MCTELHHFKMVHLRRLLRIEYLNVESSVSCLQYGLLKLSNISVKMVDAAIISFLLTVKFIVQQCRINVVGIVLRH